MIIGNDRHIQDREERYQKAYISFGTGMMTSLLYTLTQPTRAIEDWHSYRQKYKDPSSPSSINPQRWFLAPYPGGIIAGINF
jgi:hypothetical protein